MKLIENLIRNLEGRIGIKIRYLYYKKKLGHCGKNVIIDQGVIISNPKLVFLGDNVWLDNYVIILTGKPQGERKIFYEERNEFKYEVGELHIENNVHIAPFCILQSHGGILIKKNSGVASGSKIYSLSHHYRNLKDRNDKKRYFFTPMVNPNDQALKCSPVVIGEGSAIGLNTSILPGTIIPDGTWVGVNTYVSGNNYQENSIYATQPAKFIKNI